MQFDFTVSAGGGQGIEVRGNFVKYVAGAGKIRVRITSGGYIDLLPGQGARGLSFERLIIEDRTGNGGFGTILAGAFEFQDDRITGDVSVIDGGKNRTLANMAHVWRGDNVYNQAGQYCYSALTNPAGSVKNLVIESVSVACMEMAATFSLGFMTGTLAAKGGTLQSPSEAKSKKAGAAQSVAQTSYITTASDNGSGQFLPGTSQLLVLQTAQSTPALVQFKEPLVVVPGYTFYVWNATQGAGIRAWAEFYEDAI